MQAAPANVIVVSYPFSRCPSICVHSISVHFTNPKPSLLRQAPPSEHPHPQTQPYRHQHRHDVVSGTCWRRIRESAGREDELEADVARVEAVGGIDLGHVFWVRERDVDAVIERGAVDSCLDHLDCGVVADIDGNVGGERHLWEAKGAWGGVLVGASGYMRDW